MTPNNEAAGVSGRDAAFYLQWALDVLSEHGLDEFSILMQQMHREAEQYLAALTAAQPPVPDCDRARISGWWNCACEKCVAHKAANTIGTAPPSAPVGTDNPAYRAGYAQGVDDSRKHECACTRTEALAQQPAQAAPGDEVLRAMTDEYMRWIDFYHRGEGDYADFLRHALRHMHQAATPPGDDEAGGGHG